VNFVHGVDMVCKGKLMNSKKGLTAGFPGRCRRPASSITSTNASTSVVFSSWPSTSSTSFNPGTAGNNIRTNLINNSIKYTLEDQKSSIRISP
jgi:hypothetical protein